MSNTTAKKSLVFPGQGAQAAGMGQQLYNNCAAAKEIFDKLEAIRTGTLEQCFNGTKEQLSLTINAQPCIFAVSLAGAASISEDKSFDALAGFSVGEIAAITHSGMVCLEDGFKMVIKRAELMHTCASNTNGTMAAVLKLGNDKVENIASECGVYPVNYNAPGQIVVSGLVDKIATFTEKATAAGARVMPLAVSGAFHSPYMQEAADGFREFLSTITFNKKKLPVYSNVTASPYTGTEGEIKDLLSKQISSPVLWTATIKHMLKEGIEEFYEAEPGKVLTGLIAKIRQ